MSDLEARENLAVLPSRAFQDAAGSALCSVICARHYASDLNGLVHGKDVDIVAGSPGRRGFKSDHSRHILSGPDAKGFYKEIACALYSTVHDREQFRKICKIIREAPIYTAYRDEPIALRQVDFDLGDDVFRTFGQMVVGLRSFYALHSLKDGAVTSIEDDQQDKIIDFMGAVAKMRDVPRDPVVENPPSWEQGAPALRVAAEPS